MGVLGQDHVLHVSTRPIGRLLSGAIIPKTSSLSGALCRSIFVFDSVIFHIITPISHTCRRAASEIPFLNRVERCLGWRHTETLLLYLLDTTLYYADGMSGNFLRSF